MMEGKEFVSAWQDGKDIDAFSELELEAMIGYLSERYDLGEPIVDDVTFDALERVLAQCNPSSKSLRNVGAPVTLGVKVQHDPPMLSQEKALTPEKIQPFVIRYRDFVQNLVVSEKLDGAALSLIYEATKDKRGGSFDLKSASTRGDGFFGEDVTFNAITIPTIPRSLFPTDVSFEHKFEIRGEVVISHTDFEAINKENVKKGLAPFSNPRNLAAGTLRLTDYEEVKRRCLRFVAYDLISSLGWTEETPPYALRLRKLKEWGFATVRHQLVKADYDLIGELYVKSIDSRTVVGGVGRDMRVTYDCDGLVIRLNRKGMEYKFGQTGHHPRYSIALKWPAESAQIEIASIEWGGSRESTLSPVAIFKNSVKLAGATINRVSLHNIDNIMRLRALPGALVRIQRSGDVIPTIIEGDSNAPATEEEVLEHVPTECPYCQAETKIVQYPGGDLRMVKCSSDSCSFQRAKQLQHWLTEVKARGWGEKLLNKLVERRPGLTILQLHALRIDEVRSLLQISPKYALRLKKVLDNVININAEDFLSGLGLDRCARLSCRKLLDYFEDPEQLLYISAADWMRAGVGEAVAKAGWEAMNRDRKQILEMMSFFQIQRPVKRVPIDSKLSGKKVCITGTFVKTRAEITRIVTEQGGLIVGSVSGNTDMLLVGKDPGSKVTKATSKGIRILYESEFWKVVG